MKTLFNLVKELLKGAKRFDALGLALGCKQL